MSHRGIRLFNSMALIRCTECGHEVSDKAMQCPNCGCPIHKIKEDANSIAEGEKVIVVSEESANNNFDDETFPIEEAAQYYDEEPKSNRGVIIAFSVAVTMVIVGAVFMYHNGILDRFGFGKSVSDSISDTVKVDYAKLYFNMKDSLRNDSLMKDSIAKAKDEYKKNIFKEYKRILYNNKRFDYEDIPCRYFLHDITNDKVPELWIVSGSSTVDTQLLVYTYKNGIKKLYEDCGDNSTFHKGNGYILQCRGRQGNAYWLKFFHDGKKVQVECIFAEELTNEDFNNGKCYTEPKEQEVEMYDYSNLEPLKDALGIE